ncbi:caleosin family protein [Sporobolomyces koalae]|uniref:caleosin family protein n=1 Tax=Sporobolomyces koalae TaxID=500713 RepID=UPI00317FCFEA
MSYAEAAHHAPATSEPTPDPNLLVTEPQASYNPEAKHVKIKPSSTASASSSAQDDASRPPKAEQAGSQQGTAANAASISSKSTASSAKKKKSKKNKKESPETSQAEADDQQKDVGKSRNAQSESGKKAIETQQTHKDDSNEEDAEGREKLDKSQRSGQESRAQKEDVQENGDNRNSQDVVSDQNQNSSSAPGSDFDTEIKSHSSMFKRPTVPKDLDQKLAQPYVPRANIAATPERPDGTVEGGWAKKHKDETVLQQHVAFFDRDSDGIIWPYDTFIGFYDLGYALVWCILAVFLIHPTFSYFTLSSWIPDPFFRVRVKTIHRARHGSDTGTYDEQGRFSPAKFEEIFHRFDQGDKGGLTFMEGLAMIRENRNVMDPIGWIGAFFEWFASYLLIWPKNGVVMKEDLRTIYDGSIFFAIAEKESTVRARQQRIFSGWFKENRATSDLRKYSKKVE